MGAAAGSTHIGARTETVAPGRWPLLGHTPSLLRQRFSFTSSLRDHGDLVKVYLGPMPAYVATTPELVHEVLVTQAGKFEQGILFDRFRPHLAMASPCPMAHFTCASGVCSNPHFIANELRITPRQWSTRRVRRPGSGTPVRSSRSTRPCNSSR